MAKWLRRGSAKPLFTGSNPVVASLFEAKKTPRINARGSFFAFANILLTVKEDTMKLLRESVIKDILDMLNRFIFTSKDFETKFNDEKKAQIASIIFRNDTAYKFTVTELSGDKWRVFECPGACPINPSAEAGAVLGPASENEFMRQAPWYYFFKWGK